MCQVFDKDNNNDKFDYGEDIAAQRSLHKGGGRDRAKEGGAEEQGALPAEEDGMLLDGHLAPPPLTIMTINKGGA